MRRLLLALLLTAPAFAPAQLIDSGARATPIGFGRFHWGFAPNSTVPGVSILRTQEALDAFWSANNGRPGLNSAIAPWRPDFKQGQLIAIVLPKELRFDAWPMVTKVEQASCWRWHIEVAPTPGTVNPGIGAQVPFVIVRTPFGPNAVDVVIRDPEGRVVETIRTTRTNGLCADLGPLLSSKAPYRRCLDLTNPLPPGMVESGLRDSQARAVSRTIGSFPRDIA